MKKYCNPAAINRQPVATTLDTSVAEALGLMSFGNSNCVLVHQSTEPNSPLVGLLTQRDIVRLIASGIDLHHVTVAAVISHPPVTVTESEVQDIFAIMRLLHQHGISHLPVVNDAGHVIGIVTPQSLREPLQPADLLTFKHVKEVMDTNIFSVNGTDSLLKVAQLMDAGDSSSVVIVKEQGLGSRGGKTEEGKGDKGDLKAGYSCPTSPSLISVGIITAGDIVQFCQLGLDFLHTQGSEVMSTPLFFIRDNNDLWTAHQIMQKHLVRHLVVCNNTDELLGIVTQTGILSAINPLEMWNTLESLHHLVDEKTQELIEANQRLQKEIFHRRLMEEKLKSSEAKLRATFESMTDMVLVINTQERQIENVEIIPTNCSHFYTNETDLVTQTIDNFFQYETANIWLEKVQEALDTKQRLHFDYCMTTEDHQLWFTASISPISETSVIWVARDISDRKRAEAAIKESEAREREKAQQLEITLEQLQNTQAQLIQSEKMSSLGSLVAGVAHEINNPTSFIYGNIQPATEYTQDLLYLIDLYQQHYPDSREEITQYIQNIDLNFIRDDFPKLLNSMKQGAVRINHIVQSLKNFSRLDQAKWKRVDIHEGIDNTLLLLSHRLKPQRQRREIQVIKDYSQLPKIDCYPSQLNQVFMNILSNAIDAVSEWEPDGHEGFGENSLPITHYPLPTIHIRTYTKNNRVIIAIANNGAAIDPELIKRIFDPFFTTKAPGKGTGLGLYISYKIIEEHGGQLSCNSEVGQGTEFIIELPMVHREWVMGNG
ncbi:MAG: CBS domain-containing protein [Nostocaceae cyanobacterium]|nr:CBS domain-containing protein [Nostocaceae cyanobacterium]